MIADWAFNRPVTAYVEGLLNILTSETIFVSRSAQGSRRVSRAFDTAPRLPASGGSNDGVGAEVSQFATFNDAMLRADGDDGPGNDRCSLRIASVLCGEFPVGVAQHQASQVNVFDGTVLAGVSFENDELVEVF